MNVTNRNTDGTALLIAIAFIAFISLGLPDGLLGTAYPSMRASFNLPVDALGPLLFTFIMGFLVTSTTSGTLVARLGIGRLLAASCALTGVALIGYTLVPAWWLVVVIGFAAGAGAGAIDSGINTYMATNFGDAIVFWLHASFGLGAALGPLIMTIGLSLLDSWRFGYAVVGAFQLLLAILFFATAHRWRVKKATPDEGTPTPQTPLLATLRLPAAWLSIAVFFIYTGLELSAGQWSYTLFTEARGIQPEVAGFVVGVFWGTFTVGRVLAGIITRYLSATQMLRLATLGVILGTGLMWSHPTPVLGLLGLPLAGFALAPIFPQLIANTRARIGDQHAANTIGFQVGSAAVGGAIVPGAIGVIARSAGIESISLVLLVCAVALFGLYLLLPKTAPA